MLWNVPTPICLLGHLGDDSVALAVWGLLVRAALCFRVHALPLWRVPSRAPAPCCRFPVSHILPVIIPCPVSVDEWEWAEWKAGAG